MHLNIKHLSLNNVECRVLAQAARTRSVLHIEQYTAVLIIQLHRVGTCDNTLIHLSRTGGNNHVVLGVVPFLPVWLAIAATFGGVIFMISLTKQ